ncbi:rhodanese-like domain-containing protein [Planktotalea arctica]|uniref:rhodanese-like domain-containing protein n=1 Tax=Planktotalea arctica TaxID=1481893 RepID=UPI000A174F26|nr:rhodanese-like domain-containing protein [Planktotalea arctica]
MLRCLFLSFLLLITTPLAAEPSIISAPDAFSASSAGEMILVDIRSPAEWVETGVAEGAIALTMHDPAFPKQISALLNANKDQPVALICATGGRTQYVVSFLAKNGFPDVIDVSEGMFGNARGPGWIARGLPLIAAKEAQAAYRSLLK